MAAREAGFGSRSPEERKEIAAAGNVARSLALSPERRTKIAAMAAYSRWYNVKRPHEQRIDDHLRSLARMAVRAMMAEDDMKLLKVQAVMATYERMKMWVDQRAGLPGGVSLEMAQEGDEAMRKFEEGKASAGPEPEEAQVIVETKEEQK